MLQDRSEASAAFAEAKKVGGHRFVRRVELLIQAEETARLELAQVETERRHGLDETVVLELMRDVIRTDSRYADATRAIVESERKAREDILGTADRKWRMFARLCEEGAARLQSAAVAS